MHAICHHLQFTTTWVKSRANYHCCGFRQVWRHCRLPQRLPRPYALHECRMPAMQQRFILCSSQCYVLVNIKIICLHAGQSYANAGEMVLVCADHACRSAWRRPQSSVPREVMCSGYRRTRVALSVHVPHSDFLELCIHLL